MRTHEPLGKSVRRGRVAFAALAALAAAGPTNAGPRGELDPTFGHQGQVTVGWSSVGSAIVQQADGKLLLAGHTIDLSPSTDFAVLRLNHDGTPDESFGDFGAAMIDFDGADDYAFELAVLPDGRILAAGRSERGNRSLWALARLQPDGASDPTFGANGRATLDLGGRYYDTIEGLVPLPDGQFVVSGTGGDVDVVLARFAADGSLDATFGTGTMRGTTLVDIEGRLDESSGLVRQADGKYVACGYTDIAELVSQAEIIAVRLNADGSLDGGFGSGGVVRMSTGTGFSGARDCIAMPNGDVVLAGFQGQPGDVRLMLARLRSDGMLDAGFGDAGIADIPIGRIAWAQSILRSNDGTLAVTGFARGVDAEDATDMYIARIRAGDGSLDPTFGHGGITIADFGRGYQSAYAEGAGLIEQEDGKLVAVGVAHSYDWNDWLGGTAAAAAMRVDSAGASHPGFAGFTAAAATVGEWTGRVSFAVRRTGGSTGSLSVDYATLEGAARAVSDYTPHRGTLTWQDGDMEPKLVTVVITDDETSEPQEHLFVELSNSTGALATSGFVIAIEDDDPNTPVPPAPAGPPGNEGDGGGGAADAGWLLALGFGCVAAKRRRRAWPFDADSRRAAPLTSDGRRQDRRSTNNPGGRLRPGRLHHP